MRFFPFSVATPEGKVVLRIGAGVPGQEAAQHRNETDNEHAQAFHDVFRNISDTRNLLKDLPQRKRARHCFRKIYGSVREICGVAHVVSLAQRILGVMAHVR